MGPHKARTHPVAAAAAELSKTTLPRKNEENLNASARVSSENCAIR
jgi:hypothetical protein